MKICVLGCGVVGLTTALEIQNKFSGVDVHIVADKFGDQTTSYAAAGIFRPGTSFSGPNEEITRKWINDAFEYWYNISNTDIANTVGVRQLSAYAFSTISPDLVKNRYLENLLPKYRSATIEELQMCPGAWKYGAYYETVLTNFGIFQKWATNKFQSTNGIIINRCISKFSDLATDNYDVVVNCTGFGARQLCTDHKVVPIRGQIVKVYAPWQNTAIYGDCDTYIIPSFDGEVTLGGTRQYEDWNMNVSEHDSIGIRNRCCRMVPKLTNAPVLRETVGLRPHRDVVRVEAEFVGVDYGRGHLKVIHNYGHGGYGVTTSPGTAKHVAKIVKDLHSMSGSKL